jgi:hypothetical protein
VGKKSIQMIMFCFPQVIAVVDSITSPGRGDTLTLAAGHKGNHIIWQNYLLLKGQSGQEIGLKV